MAVLSLLKRKDAGAASADEAATVQAARVRARRRLIGAAVLVGLGIIAFPLVFETQPRPIAVDIPIEIPARDSVAPLTMPPARNAAPRAAGEVQGVPAAAASGALPAAPPAAEPAQAKAEPAATKAEPAAAKTEPAAAPKAEPAPQPADAQRAQALLEGKGDDAAAKTPRFVVQAGAYSDAASLREARQKVEKLGLKTYTQVVTTDAGSRTRVRVGPFATRDEAEAAAARIKGSGLAANILSL